MMKSRWSVLGGILLGTFAGLAGCSSGDSANPVSASDELAKAPLAEGAKEGQGHRKGLHGKHGMHGPDNLLRAALHELELTEAQETTINNAIEKLREGEPPKKPAMFAALAEGVRAGSIDKAAIEAKLGKDGAMEEHRARMAEALSTLHATLTKEQRRELVDAIAAKMDEKGPRGGKGDWDGKGHGGKGKHGGRGDHGMKGGPLGLMLRDLNLTDEQQAKIDQALEANRPSEADREEKKEAFEAMRAEGKARLQSFAADSFDAKAFLAEGGKMGPKAHLDRMITSLAAIVPVLTPEQRATLADRLEKGPMGMHERGEKRGDR